MAILKPAGTGVSVKATVTTPVDASAAIAPRASAGIATGDGGAAIAASPALTRLLFSFTYKAEPDKILVLPKISVKGKSAAAEIHACLSDSVKPRQACD